MLDHRPGRLLPVLAISAGGLLLVQNLGLLPAGLWAALARLWPVLIILVGLDMVIGRRSARTMALMLLLAAVVVTGALTWAALRASGVPLTSTQYLILTSTGAAQSLAVEVDFNTGALDLAALGPSDYSLEGTALHGPAEGLRQEYDVRAGVGHLLLEQQTNSLLMPFLAGRTGTARWEVRLTAELPLALEVSTGAGNATLNLTGFTLTRLDLDTGTGQTTIVLPDHGKLRGRVDASAGETVLALPPGMPARLTVRSGFDRVEVPAVFALVGTVYTTPGFDPSGDHIDLELYPDAGRVIIK